MVRHILTRVFVFMSGPFSQFLKSIIFPVLLPGLEAMLKEAKKHQCFEV